MLAAAWPLLTALLAVEPALAQDDGFRCGANAGEAFEARLRDPGFVRHAEECRARQRAEAGQRGGGGPFIIPMVFHIIHDNGDENISDAQIEDAVRILNEDYNRQNPDWTSVRAEFLDRVGDIGISFRLAQRDPQGNCTNGITRTQSARTNDGDFEMTQLIRWPRDRYLNVYVAASANGAAGYTYYPMWVDGWPEGDHIVILHNYTGSIGTSSPSHARVLTHEVGHWLNLAHCWGDSNEPGLEENCQMDDGVDDTPLTKGWTNCLLAGASCGNAIDNVQNYMEYSYCCRMFTEGQGARMRDAINSAVAQRSSLWQPQNLQATGVALPPQLCQVRFQADRRDVCAGTVVRFTETSFSGVTARAWSFPGGQPGESDSAAPEVTYAEPGLYPVTLQVSNDGGSLSETAAGYIRVRPSPGRPLPWSEGFEAVVALPDADWSIEEAPVDDLPFRITTVAASSGSRSVRLSNGPDLVGRVDRLISNTIDLSADTAVAITFRYAFAKRQPADNDALYVYASGDCGNTWDLRRILRGSTFLPTAPMAPEAFIPASPSQWGLDGFSNLLPSMRTSQFRLMFEFTSDGGNDLYLDDINIESGFVGLTEPSDAPHAVLFPNPASGTAWLRVAGLGTGASIELIDATGRTVRSLPQAMLSTMVPLDVAGLASGCYSVRVRSAWGVAVAKLQVD
jgi:PKD repeat protein